jgi:opacity protein-like surface antigen
MKTTFLASCALVMAAATPAALAQMKPGASRYYITATAGLSALGERSAVSAPASGPGGSGNLLLGRGPMFGGSVGTWLNEDWRLEAEVNWRRDKLRESRVPGLAGTQSDADLASLVLMANVMRDFDGWQGSWARFRPYIGAGVGRAQEIDVDLTAAGQAREFSGSRSAWQLLAGVNWDYGSGWLAGAGLRYVNAGRAELKSTPGGDILRVDYKGLGLDLRVGYRF